MKASFLPAALIWLMFTAGMHSGVFAQKAALKVQLGHNKAIAALEVSPDQKFALSGGFDNAVKLWNVKTGRLIRGYYGHKHFVKDLAFHPSGNIFASASWDKTVRLYRISEEAPYRTLKGHERGVEAVAFSGKVVVSASLDQTVRLWSTETGQVLNVIECGQPVHALALQPGKDRLAIGLADGSIQLRSATSGDIIRQWEEHESKIKALKFHNDGSILASISTGKRIKLWDPQESRSITTMRNLSDLKNNYSGFNDIAFSQDGKALAATTTENEILVWKVPEGNRISTTNTKQYETGQLAPGKNMRFAWVSSGKALTRWELNTGTKAGGIEAESLTIRVADVDKSGNRLALGTGTGLIRVLDFNTGRILHTFFTSETPLEALNFVPQTDKLMVVNRDGTIHIYDLNNSKENRTFREEGGRKLVAADLRVDGKYFATAANKTIKFRDLSNGKLMRTFEGHNDRIMDVSLSKNGKWIASAGWDGRINIWDVHGNKLKQYFNKPDREYWSVLFHPDNAHVFTGTESGLIQIWELGTSQPVKQWKAHEDIIECMALSPDQSTLVTGSWDKTIKVWDAPTGTLKATLEGHQNYIKTLRFTPNGRFLISGAADGQLKIWEIPAYQERLTYIPSDDNQNFVVTQPMGYFDGSSASLGKKLHYVKGSQTIPLTAFSERYRYPNLWALVMKDAFEPGRPKDEEIVSPPEVSLAFTGNEVTQNRYNHYEAREKQITVQVRVQRQQAGIDEIRLYHNGKLVENTTRGFKKIEETHAVTTREFQISLLNKENTLYATALDTNRTEAESQKITVMFRGAAEKPELHMMVVGINKYKNASLNLNYAIADAEAFIDKTKSGARSIFSDVSVYFLKNNGFTRDKFIKTLGKITRRASPEDVFVFYYAGHGTIANAGAREDFFLVPHGITQLYGNDEALQQNGISTAALREFTTEIPARKQLLFLDACHSGKAVKSFNMRGAAEQKALFMLAESSGVTMISSTDSEQYASEVSQIGHGIFTYALLEAIEGKADGGRKDGSITVKEIDAYLGYRVPELTQQYRGQFQKPMSFSEGQDFPLVIVNE